MWTPTTHRHHSRAGLRPETDLTEAGWAVIGPQMPEPASCGILPVRTMREMLNTIFCVLRGGIAWRPIPKDLPPHSTRFGCFVRWRDQGLFQHIDHRLLMADRERVGREVPSSAAVFDSRTAPAGIDQRSRALLQIGALSHRDKQTSDRTASIARPASGIDARMEGAGLASTVAKAAPDWRSEASMTAILDRPAFFARVRRDPFPGHLTPGQVSGMEAILDACPPDWPTDWLAYALGTCPIETGWTMRPIAEKGGAAYFTRMYDIRGNRPAKARELGNLTPGDGARFCGRGYVQLTGRANYRTLTARLRGLGSLTRAQDLEATPDLALQPDLAAAILFVGMSEGLFTGRRLASYFGAGKADWTGARRIINGQDRAAEIARHAKAFRAALVAAGHRPGAVTPAMPVQPVEADPLPPLPEPAVTVAAPPSMPAPPAAQGWWAWLAGLFRAA